MERTKTKEVSQLVEVDVIPPSPVGLVSVKTSPDVTPVGPKAHHSSFDDDQLM